MQKRWKHEEGEDSEESIVIEMLRWRAWHAHTSGTGSTWVVLLVVPRVGSDVHIGPAQVAGTAQ